MPNHAGCGRGALRARARIGLEIPLAGHSEQVLPVIGLYYHAACFTVFNL